MSRVVALAGSPSARSRSSGLLQQAIDQLTGSGITVRRFSLSDFSAEDLVYGRFDSPGILAFNAAIKDANGFIVSSPIYKAAYAGGLKAVIDLLPEGALADKVSLGIGTGGSAAFTLSLDHALQPVFNSLKVKFQVGGVFATDRQLSWSEDGSFQIDADIAERLRLAVSTFASYLPHPSSGAPDSRVLVDQIRRGQISV